jgi:hypothetical protein
MPPCCGAHGALLAFFLYSVTVVVRFAGDAGSTIFLALLLIAGRQS